MINPLIQMARRINLLEKDNNELNVTIKNLKDELDKSKKDFNIYIDESNKMMDIVRKEQERLIFNNYK